MKHRRNNLTEMIHLSIVEGLSYGQYVSKEFNLRTERKPIPANYISINERKQHGINLPLYTGKTTLQAAARIDFEQTLKKERLTLKISDLPES